MEDSLSSNTSFRKTNCITEKIDHPEKFANALFSHSMQGEDFLCPRECAPFTHVVLTYLKLEKSERKMLKVSQFFFFPSLELAQKYVDDLKSHTGSVLINSSFRLADSLDGDLIWLPNPKQNELSRRQ